MDKRQGENNGYNECIFNAINEQGVRYFNSSLSSKSHDRLHDLTHKIDLILLKLDKLMAEKNE